MGEDELTSQESKLAEARRAAGFGSAELDDIRKMEHPDSVKEDPRFLKKVD